MIAYVPGLFAFRGCFPSVPLKARRASRMSERKAFSGRAVKGGSEGFRMMPDAMTRKVHVHFTAIGRSLAREGRFDSAAARRAKPRRLSLGTRALMSALSIFGLPDFYWNMLLKKYGAWKKRFDQPYAGYVKSNI
jgi:hypothetical protein